jgi:hypothetical protein
LEDNTAGWQNLRDDCTFKKSSVQRKGAHCRTREDRIVPGWSCSHPLNVGFFWRTSYILELWQKRLYWYETGYVSTRYVPISVRKFQGGKQQTHSIQFVPVPLYRYVFVPMGLFCPNSRSIVGNCNRSKAPKSEPKTIIHFCHNNKISAPKQTL